MGRSQPEHRRRAGLAVNVAAGAAGLALLIIPLRMGPGWADRHFLPAWAYGWDAQLRILLVLRLFVAALGAALILLVRPWAARAVREGRGRQAALTAATALLAVAAAFVATEGILRIRTWQSTQERWDLQEPLRARDPLYGWSFVPNHGGQVVLRGRLVHYATGPFGYRAPAVGVGVDFARPTIVFAGESIVFGYGLEWPETIPAQVQAMTGLQAANIAVNAHATDQSYLRLRRELPRFARPVAVVIPFMPRLFDRNLDRDRPHLDAALRWHPAGPPPLRLVEMARRVTRYRSREAIAGGIAMTQAALRATIEMARARGARAIVLVPQFLPEEAREREVRRDVLDAARIPYLLVPIPKAWRDPFHGHPDARGARAIAEAICAELGRSARQPGLWCRVSDSNGRPTAYKAVALPAELTRPAPTHESFAPRGPAPAVPVDRAPVAGRD